MLTLIMIWDACKREKYKYNRYTLNPKNAFCVFVFVCVCVFVCVFVCVCAFLYTRKVDRIWISPPPFATAFLAFSPSASSRERESLSIHALLSRGYNMAMYGRVKGKGIHAKRTGAESIPRRQER